MVDEGWGRPDIDWLKINKPGVLANARKRGKEVHAAIDRYVAEDAGYVDELSDISFPLFESFLAVADDLPLTPAGISETPTGGWCGYGTTPDRVEPRALIEWKGTHAIHPNIWIQLAGQEYALSGGQVNRPRIIVHLQKSGKRAKVLTDEQPERTTQMWKATLEKREWKKEVNWK